MSDPTTGYPTTDPTPPLPTPQQIVQAEAQLYLDFSHAPGCCIAVYDQTAFGNEGYVYPLGMSGPPGSSPAPFAVTSDTVFEIGSVTKVFTATLLAQAVMKEGTNIDDTLGQWLNYKHNFSDKPVGSTTLIPLTLQELVTHTSGMPDLGGGYSEQLFADQKPSQDMLNWWNGYPPSSTPPGCWRYSNIGFVTLGFALTQAFDAPDRGYNYNTLLAKYVTGPLGMKQTGATIQPSWKVAQGCIAHWWQLPTPPYPPIFAGNEPVTGTAFDLKTTGDDMVLFLAAQVAAPDGPIGKQIQFTQMEQGNYPQCENSGKNPPKVKMGLGWQMSSTAEGHTIYVKDGATSRGGFEAIVMTVPDLKCGVAVLSNQFLESSLPYPPQVGLGGIARNIIKALHPHVGLPEPLPERDVSE